MAVDNIENETDFDQAVSSAENLVIVDYSTTWCGPCKFIAPKFDELSDKYTTAKFLKASSSRLTQTQSTASVESVILMRHVTLRKFNYFSSRINASFLWILFSVENDVLIGNYLFGRFHCVVITLYIGLITC